MGTTYLPGRVLLVVDLNERPAVAPMDAGGDARIGFRVAALFLGFVGFGVMVLLNLILHLTAPASGTPLGPWVIPREMGAYAWIVFGLGLAAGVTAVGLWMVARSSPRGRFVLPGQPFP